MFTVHNNILTYTTIQLFRKADEEKQLLRFKE